MKWFIVMYVALFACDVCDSQFLVNSKGTTIAYKDTNNVWHSQPGAFADWNEVVTDSVVWRTVQVDSLNMGNGLIVIKRHVYSYCDFIIGGHNWVYSETRWPGLGFRCAVNHNGFHCDWDDLMRNRICKNCLRKETQREFWYQHRKKKPETEYEKLEEQLK